MVGWWQRLEKLSASKQELAGTWSYVSKSLKPPTPSQRTLQFSPSAQQTVQCSSCSPQTTVVFLSSQENLGTFSSSPGYPEHSPPAPGGQAHPLSTVAASGPLLISKGHKKNFRAPKGTLPVQSSLSPIQRNLAHSSHSTGDLGQNTHTQSTFGHLPCVGEDAESSQSASGSIGSLILHPGEYLVLSPSQETASSDHRGVQPCLSAKGTLKGTKSSPSSQGHGGIRYLHKPQ